MNPIDFPEANRTFTRPPNMTDEECQPLKVLDTGEALVSRWLPDEEERRKLAAGATLELWIIGRGHPVVSIQTGPLPPPGPAEHEAVAHTPWDAFASLGPIPSATALDLAVNFENRSRTLYRDDLRWIVDSLLAARDQAAIAVKAAREERQACAQAQAELAGWKQGVEDANRIAQEHDAARARAEEANASLVAALDEGRADRISKLPGAGGGERTGSKDDGARVDAPSGMEAARSGGTAGDATGAVIAGEMAPAGPAATVKDEGMSGIAKGAFRHGWALACHTIAAQMRMLGAVEAAAKVDAWGIEAPELETVILQDGETLEQAQRRLASGVAFIQLPGRGASRG